MCLLAVLGNTFHYKINTKGLDGQADDEAAAMEKLETSAYSKLPKTIRKTVFARCMKRCSS